MATRPALLLIAFLLLCGCANMGALYTDVTFPLTRDFDRTPAGTTNCIIKIYKVREPVTRAGVSASWSRSDVKEAAARAGITNLYFADKHTRSYFFGIFSQRSLIFYGE